VTIRKAKPEPLWPKRYWGYLIYLINWSFLDDSLKTGFFNLSCSVQLKDPGIGCDFGFEGIDVNHTFCGISDIKKNRVEDS
jgi:hypothetical protein